MARITQNGQKCLILIVVPKEREVERERQTDRQTDRHRESETERETERDRQRKLKVLITAYARKL